MVIARRSVVALVLFALGWMLAVTASAATTDTTTTVTTTTTATTTHTETTTTTATQPATTETTTVTSTATNPSHTTTINQTTTVAPSSAGKGSGVPGWVWVLIGLGAVGVAITAYMLGRSSGARSEYEAQQRAADAAAAQAGYPPGPGRPVPPRRPPPPPDWPAP